MDVVMGNNRRITRMDGENGRNISEGKAQTALEKMRTGKAPGLNGVHVECLIKRGRIMVEWLVRLFCVFQGGSRALGLECMYGAAVQGQG